MLRIILMIAGVAAVVVGLLWVAQGMGAVETSSWSLAGDDRTHVIRGALLALAGVVVALFAGLPGRR